MAEHSISNGAIIALISEHGAELKSVKDCKTGREYLWQADSKFWGRTSPVLFPVVGNFKGKKFSFGGRTYSMGQHGFARDSEFSMDSKTETEIWFSLCDNEITREIFPFSFELKIGYKLEGRSARVMWRVANRGKGAMHFSIGAHPAFNCALGQDSLSFSAEKDFIEAGVLTSEGTLSSRVKKISLENSRLLLTDELFSEDALIIECSGPQKISLADSAGKETVRVEFNSPLVGIWSPANKGAPFVCIEPWYGRADRDDFSGALKDREWGNTIQSGEEFRREYSMTFFE